MSGYTGDSVPNESANTEATRPWFKKKRWWVGGVVLITMIAVGGGGDTEEPALAASDSTSSASEAETTEEAPAEEKSANDKSAKDKSDKEKAAAEEEPAEEAEPAAEDPADTAVKVEAAKIVKEFEKNELAADAKYKGKDLQITGKVIEIDTDLWDDEKYILSLGKGKWDFLTVNCHDMSTDELATLKVGQSVTVNGTFDDGGDLGVEVNDCALA